MKAIYKYELTELSPTVNKVLMSKGSKILAFQAQPHTGLCLWAIAPIPDKIPAPKRDEETGEVIAPAPIPQEERLIEVVGTGWPYDDKNHAEYIGTTQDRHQMVWHAFEVVETPVVAVPVVAVPVEPGKGKK